MLVYPTGIPTGGTGYTIENSLWFDGSADYLTRTPSSAGNQQIWTLSWWQKKTWTGVSSPGFWGVGDLNFSSGNANDWIFYDNSDKINIQLSDASSGTDANMTSAMVDRDTTAWAHWIVAVNTTLSTDSEKVRVYRNGTEITDFGSPTDPGTSINCRTNGTDVHRIGGGVTNSSNWWRGYLAEIIMIDGAQEVPADFGEYDDNGVWVPINPSGLDFSGTNSFHLDFKVAPGTGNGAGTDASGRGNHFTDVSMTTAQKVIDSPTDDADNNIGNYATINPLNMDGGAVPVISNGNTTFTRNATGASDNQQAYATQVAVGKKYWEFLITGNSNAIEVGWASPGNVNGNQGQGPTYYGGEVYLFQMNAAGGSAPWPLAMIEGAKGAAASTTTSLDSGEITTTPRLKFAIDTDAKKYWLGVVHGSYGGWCNTSGVGGQTFSEAAPTGTWTSDKQFLPYVFAHAQTGAGTFYFRDADWTDSAPSGFTALNTAHLPTPTVTKPSEHFGILQWTGNGGASRLIATGESGVTGTVNFTPDVVWVKRRDAAQSHFLFDNVRTVRRYLHTNTSDAEPGVDGGLVSFAENGFNIDNTDSFNTSSQTRVAYCWKVGGRPTTDNNNTSGAMDDGSVFKGGSVQNSYTPSGSPSNYPKTMSIASHGGFSIVEYTGTGGNATVPHGLDRTPSFFMLKPPEENWSWAGYHSAIGTGAGKDQVIRFDTNAGGGGTDQLGAAWQNDPFATDHVITFGSQAGQNGSGDEHIMYIWARTPGLIAAGSFEGADDADGTYIVVDDGAAGFRPAWFMFKNIDGNGSWYVVDSSRNPYNIGTAVGTNKFVIEGSGGDSTVHGVTTDGILDFTANGVKFRGSNGSDWQGSNTFCYLAFAENPFGGETIAQARAR